MSEGWGPSNRSSSLGFGTGAPASVSSACSGRSRTTAATTPTSQKGAPTPNWSWKPSVRAVAAKVPESVSDDVWLAARVLSTARPSAAPRGGRHCVGYAAAIMARTDA